MSLLATTVPSAPIPLAWLETEGGQRHSLHGSCTLGRSASNQLALADQRMSRHHARIQQRSDCEFWLQDLGSHNGTFVNGRPISEPTRLFHQDQVLLGQSQFTFHQPLASRAEDLKGARRAVPLEHRKKVPVWLMLILFPDRDQGAQHFRELTLGAEQGQDGCAELVEQFGGRINKYLSNGFWASWPDEESSAARVAQALQSLRSYRQRSQAPFSLAVHLSEVSITTPGSLAHEELTGASVTLLFHMQKAALALGETFVASDAAATALQSHLALAEAGDVAASGFANSSRLYVLQEPEPEGLR